MSLKLPELGLSGCSAKVGSRDLLKLLRLPYPNHIPFLAPDSNSLSSFASLYTSIDTLLPMTRNPSNFARIAVLHSFADLYAVGARPTDACVSFGLDNESIKNNDGQSILEGASSTFKAADVKLCKAHTFRCSQTQITIAVTGKLERPLKTMELGKDYALILTKEIGAGIGCHLGWINNVPGLVSACERAMLQDHGAAAADIISACHIGTTDISGFGLLGHLAILSESGKCEIRVKVSDVPFVEGYPQLPTRFPNNCSAQRNQEDFDDLCSIKCSLPDWLINLLYNAETSGPIACVVHPDSVQEFLAKLHSKGFDKAKQIGLVRRTGINRVTVE